MKRRSFIKLLIGTLAFPSAAFAQPEDKEIYFWLDAQIGAAYENGLIVKYIGGGNGFPIISGYDGPVTTPSGRIVVKPTPKGNFQVRWKHANHVNHHGIPMPYSMFFSGQCAIHAWAWDENLPPEEQARHYSSSGCISLDLPVAENLFNWASVGTPVYVWGKRNYDQV